MSLEPGEARTPLERDFIFYLIARCCGTIAVQMQTVAVGWQVYSFTRNPLDLGWIGLSQFLPFIVLVLPAGHVADHYDRRRIVTSCYFLNALCAIALLLFGHYGLKSALPIFAVMTVLGCTRAFAMPTSQALLPNLVSREAFAKAMALNQSIFQVSTIVGPTLGGLLYLAGTQIVYGAVAVLLITATALTASLRGGGRNVRIAQSANLQSLFSGLRFVRSRPIVLGAISLDLFAVLFGGATALLPVYARDVLHAGPMGLGVLRTAPGLGAAICAGALTLRPLTRHIGPWLFGGVVLFGVATIVFGYSTNLVVSVIALTALGAGDMVSVYLRHLLVQLQTPDEIRGRVSAVNAVFIGASNELGEFESGTTAAWWGAVRAVVIGGVATLVVAGCWVAWFPQLRRMDRLPQPERGKQ
jgi:MFS family permease